MKIKGSDRVKYEHNPLIEVVGQIRFPVILELEKSSPDKLQKKLMSEYPKLTVEPSIAAVYALINSSEKSTGPMTTSRELKIYHFSSLDNVWKISVTSEFFALTCTDYEKWEDFRSRFLEAWKIFVSIYKIGAAQRLGLRYRNVIERKKIGLGNTHWSELFIPSIAGMFACNELTTPKPIPENDIFASFSQTQINLDDCKLLLNSGLVRSSQQNETAFLIDGDYYVESFTPSTQALKQNLERLHENAGAIFRRCITSKLHLALKPKPIRKPSRK